MDMGRTLLSIIGGALILVLQGLCAWLVPWVGGVFFVSTTRALRLLDHSGLALTYQSGEWVVLTKIGWAVAICGWWLLWSLVVWAALMLKR